MLMPRQSSPTGTNTATLIDRIKSALKQPLIVDGRNLYKPVRMQENGIHYIPLGRAAQGVLSGGN